MADENGRWRVKVYVLNAELQWEEKGVGYATCKHNVRLRRMCIHVEEESTEDILLETPILPISADDEVYKKQQDTLLVWEEPDGKDLALSFQVYLLILEWISGSFLLQSCIDNIPLCTLKR